MTLPFEIDIDAANKLICEWVQIAKGIARQCRWRQRGECLVTCQGLAVCNIDGLTLVHGEGRPAGAPSCSMPAWRG